MIYVLIIMTWASGLPSSTSMQEFTSLEKCKFAAQEITKAHPQRISSWCLEK